MMEEWRIIQDFPGYEVSSFGRVRNTYDGQILKPINCSEGYLFVNLYNEPRKNKPRRIHRLVGLAFLENPLKLPVIDHINQNKKDNRLENLRWVPKSKNAVNSKKRVQASGERNIYITHSQNFEVRIERESGYYCKVFPTLREAVEARNKYLA